MLLLPAYADDEQRVRPDQLLLANAVAVGGRVSRRHAVAAARQARHPTSHPRQYHHTLRVPHRHRLPGPHPRHHQSQRHRHRSSDPPLRHTGLLPLRPLERQT